MELKYGPSLTATGMRHFVLHGLDQVDVLLLDLLAGDVGVDRDVVDVQLQRVGAGLLHLLGVAEPAAVVVPLRLAMIGILHRLLALARCASGRRPGP